MKNCCKKSGPKVLSNPSIVYKLHLVSAYYIKISFSILKFYNKMGNYRKCSKSGTFYSTYVHCVNEIGLII